MMISGELIKSMRVRTGAGIMDIKSALTEAAGDEQKAIEILRKRGAHLAAKKSDRTTAEGFVAHYIHGQGRIGALVEVNCETDFVSRNPEFQQFAKEIAMQVVASDPRFVSPDQVPSSLLAKEEEIVREQLVKEAKPAEILEKIVGGKIEKFFDQACLLRQPYFRDPEKTVNDVLTEMIGKIGENIQIRRFVRFSLGQ